MSDHEGDSAHEILPLIVSKTNGQVPGQPVQARRAGFQLEGLERGGEAAFLIARESALEDALLDTKTPTLEQLVDAAALAVVAQVVRDRVVGGGGHRRFRE